jgi:CBS domain-containing protein
MDIGRVIEVLVDFTHQPLDPEQVDVVPDLQVIDLYAVRVAGETDYIVHAGNGTVEEVSFAVWPPRQYAVRSGRGTDEMGAGTYIEQLMSRNVRCCGADETLDEAARLMWDNDCGCVPVCSSNGTPRVIGMITDRDICMAALFGGKPLAELRVADAMSRSVHVCRPSDSPAAVERLMRERRVRRIPVADASGRLLGIVSLADLARAGRRSSADVTETDVGATLAAICEPSARAAH